MALEAFQRGAYSKDSETLDGECFRSEMSSVKSGKMWKIQRLFEPQVMEVDASDDFPFSIDGWIFMLYAVIFTGVNVFLDAL